MKLDRMYARMASAFRNTIFSPPYSPQGDKGD